MQKLQDGRGRAMSRGAQGGACATGGAANGQAGKRGVTMALAMAGLMTIATAAHADVLAQWDFNDQSLSASAGTMKASATLTTVGGVNGATFASGAGSSDPLQPGQGWQTSGYPGQGTANAIAGIEWTVSTTGYEDIAVSWDVRPSNTASRWSLLVVSTDQGMTFDEIGMFETAAGSVWFNGLGGGVGHIAGTGDNASLLFRLVSVFGPSGFGYEAAQSGSTYGGGTWRFDMITVTGTPNAIPAPAAAALLGIAGACAARRRRRA